MSDTFKTKNYIAINTSKKINFFQNEFLRNLPCSSDTLLKSNKPSDKDYVNDSLGSSYRSSIVRMHSNKFKSSMGVVMPVLLMMIRF